MVFLVAIASLIHALNQVLTAGTPPPGSSGSDSVRMLDARVELCLHEYPSSASCTVLEKIHCAEA